ncbi:MAG: ABC transporter permease [Candidatus Aminicenantes bacterium]|nr:ABC transporter permease [Candidatus Aminicenantes bacterium]
MFINYLKVTFRYFFKHKAYSLINIFGLSLGIACCILILSYIGHELSYDGYHENADNIYRIVSKRTISGKTREFALSLAPVGPTMVEDFPEVVDAVRFSPTVKRAFSYEDKKFFQENVFYADPSVFNVFSFELIEGDPNTALEVPFTMVMTEKTAQKYFGIESPMGKTVKWDNNFDYRITGVVKDPPPNSHFSFTVLASYSTFIKYDPRIDSWKGSSFPTYLLLRDGTDPKEFEQKIERFNQKYLGQILKQTGEELEASLQPLKSIHLHSHLENELGANSDIKIVYAFSAIATVILLMACINFMNLATARSSKRANEVGMRKVLGANRKSLIFQFLGESFLFSLLSFALALIMVRFFLPYFVGLSGIEISLDYLKRPLLYGGLVGIVLFIGFVGGSYPAFFLSAFKPISSLRGDFHQEAKGSRFRSLLVVFQFVMSIVLIISTIVIFNQQKYMQNKDLGFNKRNLLVIALQNKDVRLGLESLKNELLKIEGVANAGSSSMVPGEMYLFNSGTYPEGFSRAEQFMMDNFFVDYSFLDTLEIDIVKGRGFSKEMTTDVTDAVMINETAARILEWNDPLGRTIEIPSSDPDIMVKKTIIGVFKDIHQRSLYSKIDPTFIQYISNEGTVEYRARRLALRLKTGDLAGTMAKVERTWKDAFPNHPYYSFFLDDFFNSQHSSETKLGRIFRAFSVLAVVIGCLGLFGLASFTAEQRTKEIGIRKVLGSPVSAIVILLCKKFIFLVGIANLVAWPIAFYAMKKWLQNFAYPINMKLGVFLTTALLTFVVAVFTVGYQALKAALANPLESLRYE